MNAVVKAANYLGVYPPQVVFNDNCPGFEKVRTAHIHLEEYTICVSEIYLKSLSFEEIEKTATHEVTHLIELGHNERFRKAHNQIKKGIWRPPRGVLVIDGNKKLDYSTISNESPKEYKDVCNYHLCNNKNNLTQCPHCERYFCEEHIKPRIPMAPPFRGASIEEYEEWRREDGHPCPEYYEVWEKEQKIRREKYEKALAKNLRKRSSRVLKGEESGVIFNETKIIPHKYKNSSISKRRKRNISRKTKIILGSILGILLMFFVIYSGILNPFFGNLIPHQHENSHEGINSSNQHIIYVDDDGTQPYLRIKNAVYFANDGDIIYVYSGTYKEDINVNKSIEIIGENKFSTVIKGTIELSAPNIKISNLTIRPDSTLLWATESEKHWIRLANGVIINSNNNKIYNCVIENCLAGVVLGAAGQPLMDASYNSITHCMIKNNDLAISIKCYQKNFGDVVHEPIYNRFYCNNFINNKQNVDGGLAIDGIGGLEHEIPPQYWNNETMGNYWSDYTGPDANRDGIGDIPYKIDKNNVDYYPLWKPLNLGEKKDGWFMVDYLSPNLELILLICVIASLFVIYLALRKRSYYSHSYDMSESILLALALFIPFFVGLGAIFIFIFLNFPEISLTDFTNMFGDKFTLSLFTAIFLFPMSSLVSWVAWIISGFVAGLLSNKIMLPFISTYSISWLVLYLSWKELTSIFLLFRGLLLLNIIIALLSFSFGGWMGAAIHER